MAAPKRLNVTCNPRLKSAPTVLSSCSTVIGVADGTAAIVENAVDPSSASAGPTDMAVAMTAADTSDLIRIVLRWSQKIGQGVKVYSTG